METPNLLLLETYRKWSRNKKRLPSAFHLDVLLTSRCLMLSQRKNVVFSTRKKTFESPKDVLHGRPLILCPVMAPFSPCFALVEPPYLKLKASKQKLRRFYVGAQFVFVANGLETKTYSFMPHIQAGCLKAFHLDLLLKKNTRANLSILIL